MSVVILSFKKVFSKFRYSFLVMFLTTSIFSVFILLRNVNLLAQIFYSDKINFWYKFKFTFRLLLGTEVSIGTLSFILLSLVAILFSINFSLLVYYLKNKLNEVSSNQTIAGSFLGIVSGVLGVGCAVCGSVILTPLLTFLGAAGLLVFLPLKGGEFAVLAIFLILFSIYSLSKKISNPAICSV